MSNTATAKGALLTAGVTMLSAGVSLLLTDKWAIGLVIELVGVGFLFAREYLKEI